MDKLIEEVLAEIRANIHKYPACARMLLEKCERLQKQEQLQADRCALLARSSEDMERSYTHQLGELARLSDVVCGEVLSYSNTDLFPENVMAAANEIMQYVDAVRPGDGEKETRWAMHIIGPDDVIPCVGEFDALRKANQHNMAFARLAADDISLNDPYCVAVAEQI